MRLNYLTSRRRFLKCGMSLSSLAAASGCSLNMFDHHSSADPRIDRPTIDAHCHVFNASDLSVSGFVYRVVLKNYSDEFCYPRPRFPILDELATILLALLSQGAPSAAQEKRFLESEEADGASSQLYPTSREELEFFEKEKLRQSMQDLYAAAVNDRIIPGTPGFSDGRSAGIQYLLTLEALREEAKLAETVEELAVPPERNRLPFAKLADSIYSGLGELARGIRWGLLLLKPRQKIIEEYINLYKPATSPFLFTPSLVDYAYWLHDFPKSSIHDQIQVMDLLQRRVNSSENTRMHCLFPFDPWRAVVEDDVFELLEQAIHDSGFIGVKIYPPMGFQPVANENGLCFPDRARNDVGPEFPQLLNNAMAKLFKWCEAESVPIVTHANNSQDGGRDYAERANPRLWREVFKRHPKLRVNFAHFGGFEEDPVIGTTWENEVGNLAQEFESTSVYADLSYLSELLNRSDSFRWRLLVANFRKFMQTYDRSNESLLYGTDWIMVGREPTHKVYQSAFSHFLDDADVTEEVQQKIFFDNARRFFGLNRGGGGFDRLSRYYAKHDLELGWLSRV